MTILLPILSVLVSLAIMALGHFKPELSRYATGLAWAGVFTGVGLVYGGLAGSFADALAVASLAMIALMPTTMKGLALRRQVFTSTPLFALVLAAASVAAGVAGSFAVAGSAWLLLIVQGGVIAASTSAAVSGAALVEEPAEGGRPLHLGMPVVIAALAGGLGVIGALRATLPGSRYALTLTTADGPLYWGWSGGALQGHKLPVIITVDWMLAGLAVVTVLAIAGAVVAVKPAAAKIEAALFGGSALVSAGLLGNLVYLTGQTLHPSPGPYEELAKRLATAEGLPEGLAAQGGFLQSGAAMVDLTAMGPEFAILGLVFLLGLSRAYNALHSEREGEKVRNDIDALAARLWRRDLMVKAVVLGWLAWLVGIVFHLDRFGVVGFVAPGEWMVLGGMLLATGLVVMTWEEGRASKAASLLRRAIPGFIAAVWILTLCVAYGFGAFFAVSALLR